MEKWGRGDVMGHSNILQQCGRGRREGGLSWRAGKSSQNELDSDPPVSPLGTQPSPGTFTKPALSPPKLSSCHKPCARLGSELG